MSQLIKTFSQKLNAFKYLSYLIFFVVLVYAINGIDFNDKNSLSEIFSISLLGLFASGFLFYFGNKERLLSIYQEKVEYKKSIIDFEANMKDIVLIKTFREINSKTDSLIIMTNDENILSISTAFFDMDKLLEAMKLLVEINQKRDDFRVEDDRNWLTEN